MIEACKNGIGCAVHVNGVGLQAHLRSVSRQGFYFIEQDDQRPKRRAFRDDLAQHPLNGLLAPAKARIHERVRFHLEVLEPRIPTEGLRNTAGEPAGEGQTGRPRRTGCSRRPASGTARCHGRA